jgi:hypothetical protein
MAIECEQVPQCIAARWDTVFTSDIMCGGGAIRCRTRWASLTPLGHDIWYSGSACYLT